MSSSNQDLSNALEGLSEEEVHGQEPESSDHDVEVPELDYTTFQKKDFVSLLKELSQEQDIRKADKQLRALKPALDELRDQSREQALNRFIAEGGKAEDFTLRRDDDDLVIDGAIKLIREKKMRYNREQDESRKSNLFKKEALLARLRDTVEREDAAGSFQEFKKLQDEWRSVGPVPQTFNKDLWASYHALVDRFYDHRHIYLELLELDRRKNLETKKELCVKAERLASADLKTTKISSLLQEINELHNEWKHIGPVPREEKETVWQRFKTASDSVYVLREAHAKEVGEKLKQNRLAKSALLEKINPLKEFESTSIKEWNQKSVEAEEAQQLWTTIGPVERSKSRELNRQFWSVIKTFYSRKGKFFKVLDAGRQESIAKKKALIDQVNALKSAEDFSAAIEQVKQLQKDWKNSGSIPGKLSDKLFSEFKAACDHFFELRRNSAQEADRVQLENLKEKQSVVESIAGLNGPEAIAEAKELVVKFNALGMVPRRNIQEIRDRFQQALNTFTATLPEEGNLRDKTSLELELASAQNDPNAVRRIQQQEQTIRRRLATAENDLALLKNNLEFFARSKNADAVRQEFQVRISAAEAEVTSLKSKLKLIRSMS